MTMTSKVHPFKAGFGPFAPEIYRAPAPYPYRGVGSDDAIAGLRRLFRSEVDPAGRARQRWSVDRTGSRRLTRRANARRVTRRAMTAHHLARAGVKSW